MTENLTLPEAALWLRLSERALYALARSGRVPAAQVGGKWIFPRALLTRWLAAAAEPALGAPPAPPPIVAGSHDPLLDWAVRESGSRLAVLSGGSLAGLEALAEGRAVIAATHVLDPDSGGFNEAAARDALGARPAVGIVWAWRDQGLILPAGNPRGLARVEDLLGPGIRVIGRQPRAGSHVLMLHLLTEAGLRLDQINLLPDPAMAEDEVAAAVAEGRADAGFGILAEAARRGLAFVPLLRERFDLVMGLRSYFEPAFQTLLDFARGEAFRRRALAMGGYDIGGAGRVAFLL